MTMAKRKNNPKTGRPPYDGMNPSREVTSRVIRRTTLAGTRSLDYLKPKRFKNYMTLSEVALFVPVDPSWLKRLEAEGRIPIAARVPMGKLEVRLWSPAQAEEIKRIIEGHHVGRPPKS